MKGTWKRKSKKCITSDTVSQISFEIQMGTFILDSAPSPLQPTVA